MQSCDAVMMPRLHPCPRNTLDHGEVRHAPDLGKSESVVLKDQTNEIITCLPLSTVLNTVNPVKASGSSRARPRIIHSAIYRPCGFHRVARAALARYQTGRAPARDRIEALGSGIARGSLA